MKVNKRTYSNSYSGLSEARKEIVTRPVTHQDIRYLFHENHEEVGDTWDDVIFCVE